MKSTQLATILFACGSLAIPTGTAVPQSPSPEQNPTRPTVKITGGNGRSHKFPVDLDEITVAPYGARRVRDAIILEKGPWCAGFEDKNATRFVTAASNGMFDFETQAQYGSEAVKIRSYWCAATKQEASDFVTNAQMARKNGAINAGTPFGTDLPLDDENDDVYEDDEVQSGTDVACPPPPACGPTGNTPSPPIVSDQNGSPVSQPPKSDSPIGIDPSTPLGDIFDSGTKSPPLIPGDSPISQPPISGGGENGDIFTSPPIINPDNPILQPLSGDTTPPIINPDNPILLPPSESPKPSFTISNPSGETPKPPVNQDPTTPTTNDGNQILVQATYDSLGKSTKTFFLTSDAGIIVNRFTGVFSIGVAHATDGRCLFFSDTAGKEGQRRNGDGSLVIQSYTCSSVVKAGIPTVPTGPVTSVPPTAPHKIRVKGTRAQNAPADTIVEFALEADIGVVVKTITGLVKIEVADAKDGSCEFYADKEGKVDIGALGDLVIESYACYSRKADTPSTGTVPPTAPRKICVVGARFANAPASTLEEFALEVDIGVVEKSFVGFVDVQVADKNDGSCEFYADKEGKEDIRPPGDGFLIINSYVCYSRPDVADGGVVQNFGPAASSGGFTTVTTSSSSSAAAGATPAVDENLLVNLADGGAAGSTPVGV